MNAKRRVASLLLGVLLAACAGTPASTNAGGIAVGHEPQPGGQTQADRDSVLTRRAGHIAICIPDAAIGRKDHPEPCPDAEPMPIRPLPIIWARFVSMASRTCSSPIL